jgi:hypothetical protein
VIGSSAINQFLDTSRDVLRHSDWSSRSLAQPVTTSASLPLPASAQYQICGPVLGHVGPTSAKVAYRTEREGVYRVTLARSADNAVIQSIEQRLCPTGNLCIWKPVAEYGVPSQAGASERHLLERRSGGDGTLRTAPADGSPVRFSFAIGSCARNGYDDLQPVWDKIAAASTDAGPVRFFVHLGDTTYFFDDVCEKQVPDASTIAAGFLAARKHPGFLRMARKMPCYAVWDDHDFRFNNADSTNYPLKTAALQLFRDYWPNPDPLRLEYGLTSRFSYGNVDFYLMDGRFLREPAALDAPFASMFTAAQCNFILSDIQARGAGRMRVLMSGSSGTTSRPTRTIARSRRMATRSTRSNGTRSSRAGQPDRRTHRRPAVPLGRHPHQRDPRGEAAFDRLQGGPGVRLLTPDEQQLGDEKDLCGRTQVDAKLDHSRFRDRHHRDRCDTLVTENRIQAGRRDRRHSQSYVLQKSQFKFTSGGGTC